MATLEFSLEGRGGSLADFNDFTAFSAVLMDCLRRVHRLEHPRLRKVPKFEISELKIGSAVVGLSGDPATVSGFIEAIQGIRHGKLPKRFAFDDVKAFQKLADPLRRSTSAIRIQSLPVDDRFVQGCRDLLETASESMGEAIGSLDALNVHGVNYFRLYPDGQDRGVECHFDPSLFDQVQAAIKQTVLVRGKIVRDPNGVTIDRIPRVDSISVLSPAEQPPPITDLFGLFQKTPISFDSPADQWD